MIIREQDNVELLKVSLRINLLPITVPWDRSPADPKRSVSVIGPGVVGVQEITRSCPAYTLPPEVGVIRGFGESAAMTDMIAPRAK
jgi:hypothetical protein